MKKFYLLCFAALLFVTAFIFNKPKNLKPATELSVTGWSDEKDEGYDGPRERDSLEFEKIKDPALGYVPTEKLLEAVRFTDNLKKSTASRVNALTWTARGPIFDSLGPSNGNLRGGFSYTSGYMTAVLIDTLHDPSGNTVFCGGTTGGVWKCTNFLSAFPNWAPVNDFYQTLNIASICQDPTNANTMYLSTGDGVYNVVDMYGSGIWKSTDGGSNWTRLPSSINLNRSFKIVCDAAGNVYVAEKTSLSPAPIIQRFGLFRSKDQGTTWVNITPSVPNSTDSTCTDIEISRTGRLHACFGFLGTRVSHWYTDDPANVTPTTGWNASTGIRTIASPPTARRLEIACKGDTLYGITDNSTDNADSCYMSTDGGATWTKQNAAAYSTGVLNGQGYYDLTLAINPANPNEFLVGGLDAYRSTNNGVTANTRTTFWVTNTPAQPYVHADHHFMQWWMSGGESRIVIGCDGGIFLSRDGGLTFQDRNRNLSLKQFYGGDIHPTAGSPYMIAGAQDNGTHQLVNPGLSSSYEVTGGDGCFAHINQVNPLIQFGTYVYNQYRRTTNGGQTWASVNFSTTGFFVNPYDYDDGQNILYACNTTNAIRRWKNADVSNLSEVVTSTSILGAPSAFKVSPYTANRLYMGTNTGKVLRLENANTVTSGTVGSNITDISGAAFPAGFVNCVNVGSSDQFLVAVFTNYGINNIWYSNNGGSSWTGIDGNLPDMPIRWAIFNPSDDAKLYIATATGVFSTDAVNGASTVWVPESGLPTVRTDMLKLRLSDNTLMAATYGRGLFTAIIPSLPEVRFSAPSLTVTEAAANTTGCRYYKDYTVKVSIVAPPTGDATVTYNITAGNTASAGVDFDFTTNGDFTSPSNQHVFTNGVVQTKDITVRIYDDAEIEPTENFTLSFGVTGATNAVAGAARNFTFSINSNDVAPGTSTTVNATVGLAEVGLSQPFRSEFSDARTQTIYLASELIAAGLSAGNVDAIAFQVVTKASTGPFEGFTVKLKNTNTTTLPGGGVNFETGVTPVFGPASFTTVAGLNNITLTSPFVWDGVSNLLVDICYDNVAPTSATGVNDIVTGTNGGNACHFARQNVTPGCSLTTATTIFTGGPKPDLRFTITTLGTLVASALNTSRSEYLAPSNDLYFYSGTGEILARIQSQVPFNFGCTNINIDRAGTGASAFWNNNAANRLMDKTFQILPTSNNPGGQYQLTLYYTQAEKNGWETATGQSWNNIQLIKVAGQISQVTPANPGGAGTVEIVTPVRGTIGANYTLTYTFNSGFSGFGAGVAGVALPIKLIDFTGRLQNNSVALSWSTSFELNSKGFEIERSYDGQVFNRIGYAPAAGNSSFIKNYQFVDNTISQENNYYRLKQIDLDEKFEYSRVILIKNPLDKNIPFKVMKNPFNDAIDLQFGQAPQGKVQIKLFDAAGKLMMQWSEGNATSNRMRLYPTNAYLSAGIYLLHVKMRDKEFVVRIMKE